LSLPTPAKVKLTTESIIGAAEFISRAARRVAKEYPYAYEYGLSRTEGHGGIVRHPGKTDPTGDAAANKEKVRSEVASAIRLLREAEANMKGAEHQFRRAFGGGWSTWGEQLVTPKELKESRDYQRRRRDRGEL